MELYSPSQLLLIKELYPSLFPKIKRVNSFLNKDYSRLLEAQYLYSQGSTSWHYSVSLSDIVFFVKSQPQILKAIY